MNTLRFLEQNNGIEAKIGSHIETAWGVAKVKTIQPYRNDFIVGVELPGGSTISLAVPGEWKI